MGVAIVSDRANGLPYYKRYPRDFIEGTIGMPFELKAAYSIVLDLIYMQGGKLPNDDRYISGLLGCSVRKWKTIRSELVRLGKVEIISDFIQNKRAEKELETSRKIQEKNAENRRNYSKNNDLEKRSIDKRANNQNQIHKERKPNGFPKKETPRNELLRVLDDERAAAVIDHRQRIRKPLTARAAKLLAGKFAKCRDPNDAADAMIANGWQGFELEWLENRRTSERPPPSRPRNSTDIALDGLKRVKDRIFNDDETGSSGTDQTAGPVVLNLPVSGQRR